LRRPVAPVSLPAPSDRPMPAARQRRRLAGLVAHLGAQHPPSPQLLRRPPHPAPTANDPGGEYRVLSPELHDAIIAGAFRARGFSASEGADAAHVARLASWHGIHSHAGIKALHLDHHLGSAHGGCVPGADIEELPSKYPAVARWNCRRKLGQSVARRAMEHCMALADSYGTGTVVCDECFHYMWGGGYVMEAAQRGYIAYTCCPASWAEVVPFGGRSPTLGTNPHSWALPTSDAVGFPILIDWATSMMSSGAIAVLKRQGKELPPGTGVDANGAVTANIDELSALLPFGRHKGFGLSLLDELYGAFIGGSLPTLRNRWEGAEGGFDDVPPHEKQTCTFYFQCTKPDAIGVSFADDRSQSQNVEAVLADILGHGNAENGTLLPGQIEAESAFMSSSFGGLLFTPEEIAELWKHAVEGGVPVPTVDSLKQVTVPRTIVGVDMAARLNLDTPPIINKPVF
jgi:LDH2 family malate/lactate/ureidoglycolate dehydrogenase